MVSTRALVVKWRSSAVSLSGPKWYMTCARGRQAGRQKVGRQEVRQTCRRAGRPSQLLSDLCQWGGACLTNVRHQLPMLALNRCAPARASAAHHSGAAHLDLVVAVALLRPERRPHVKHQLGHVPVVRHLHAARGRISNRGTSASCCSASSCQLPAQHHAHSRTQPRCTPARAHLGVARKLEAHLGHLQLGRLLRHLAASGRDGLRRGAGLGRGRHAAHAALALQQDEVGQLQVLGLVARRPGWKAGTGEGAWCMVLAGKTARQDQTRPASFFAQWPPSGRLPRSTSIRTAPRATCGASSPAAHL